MASRGNSGEITELNNCIASLTQQVYLEKSLTAEAENEAERIRAQLRLLQGRLSEAETYISAVEKRLADKHDDFLGACVLYVFLVGQSVARKASHLNYFLRP